MLPFTTRHDFLWNWAAQLTREELVKALESISIQCYDHESKETLIEALAVNIEDGTISIPDVNELFGR